MKTISTEMIDILKKDYEKGLNDDIYSICYRRIPNTRKAGIIHQYTQAEIMQRMQCHFDRLALVNLLNISLYDFQKAILYNSNYKYFAIHASRQTGISMLMRITALYESMILGKSIHVSLSRIEDRKFFMESVKDLYCKLPFHIQSGIVSMNSQSVSFENEGRITTSLNSTIAIGFQIDTLLLDNPNDNYINRILDAILPCISALKGGKIILAITGPAGYHVNKIIDGAQRFNGDPKKNAFILQKVGYWEVPRTENWKDELVKLIGDEAFDNEYDIH